jgi:hypothetical protein
MRFEKGKDSVDSEVALSGLTVKEARTLTGSSRNDPMYESLEVTPVLARRLERYAPGPLDTGRFDYFLERRYATDE